MRSGFCPKCNAFVVEVNKRHFDGRWVTELAKRKKALKLYEQYCPDIIGIFERTIKTGNKSNMGFRYGLNTEVIKNGESTIKRYAVDFNGTKELINVG